MSRRDEDYARTGRRWTPADDHARLAVGPYRTAGLYWQAVSIVIGRTLPAVLRRAYRAQWCPRVDDGAHTTRRCPRCGARKPPRVHCRCCPRHHNG